MQEEFKETKSLFRIVYKIKGSHKKKELQKFSQGSSESLFKYTHEQSIPPYGWAKNKFQETLSQIIPRAHKGMAIV